MGKKHFRQMSRVLKSLGPPFQANTKDDVVVDPSQYYYCSLMEHAKSLTTIGKPKNANSNFFQSYFADRELDPSENGIGVQFPSGSEPNIRRNFGMEREFPARVTPFERKSKCASLSFTDIFSLEPKSLLR